MPAVSNTSAVFLVRATPKCIHRVRHPRGPRGLLPWTDTPHLQEIPAPSHFLLRPPCPSLQVLLLDLHGLDIYWHVCDPASTTLELHHLVDPSILVHVVYDGRQHSVLRWVPPMEVLCGPASHPSSCFARVVKWSALLLPQLLFRPQTISFLIRTSGKA